MFFNDFSQVAPRGYFMSSKISSLVARSPICRNCENGIGAKTVVKRQYFSFIIGFFKIKARANLPCAAKIWTKFWPIKMIECSRRGSLGARRSAIRARFNDDHHIDGLRRLLGPPYRLARYEIFDI